tara:strand:+ start:403 stop:1140 length:738 start_codon:yes stop_codon:yes gene_type:complete
MALEDLTKQIQEKVGSSADGVYGKNTALAIIKSLDFSTSDLTKIIQKKVDTIPDGAYGPNTAKEILNDLGVTNEESKPEITSAKTDGAYPEVIKKTPNVSSSSIQPEGVVLHHSSGSYDGSVSWILQSKSQVSYHVIIDTDGSRTVFAEDWRRCWHAGKSNFNGKTNCNGFLLGLAFSGDTTKRELTDAEVESAVEWLIPRFEKYGWPRDLTTVTTHKAISPGRKNDIDDRAEAKVREALKKALG